MMGNTRIRRSELISFHFFHRVFKGNSFLLVRCASGRSASRGDLLLMEGFDERLFDDYEMVTASSR